MTNSSTTPPTNWPLLRSLRPAQWVKNLFVVAPLVFAERLLDSESLARSFVAFLAFCAASSAVYLINDIRDREADRLHPIKRRRPLASGALGVPRASAVASGLAGLALTIGLFLELGCFVVIALYLILNLLYSLGLKHFVILDAMIIALGFVLRVLAGGLAIGVAVSNWLLLCTIFVALFLAFAKRRHELVLLTDDAAAQRRVLDDYSLGLLDQTISVVTASTVLAYALYAVDPQTVARFGTDRLVYTMPMVLFGVFRFLYLTYRAETERNPTEAMLRDLPFLLNLALWGVVVVALLYWS